jgi:hypothetical protein
MKKRMNQVEITTFLSGKRNSAIFHLLCFRSENLNRCWYLFFQPPGYNLAGFFQGAPTKMRFALNNYGRVAAHPVPRFKAFHRSSIDDLTTT